MEFLAHRQSKDGTFLSCLNRYETQDSSFLSRLSLNFSYFSSILVNFSPFLIFVSYSQLRMRCNPPSSSHPAVHRQHWRGWGTLNFQNLGKAKNSPSNIAYQATKPRLASVPLPKISTNLIPCVPFSVLGRRHLDIIYAICRPISISFASPPKFASTNGSLDGSSV